MCEIKLPMFACERLRMTVDGEGVTTLVTSAGCPLRCKWCLNPQSWDGRAKVIDVTPQELYDRTRVDELYFLATGGGVTFGGGEPLLHARFIKEFRALCGSEWHLTCETSLNVPAENVDIASECLDAFIVDIKDMNPDIYKSYTGLSIDRTLENLGRLLTRVGPERIIVRVPLIPDFNTKEDTDRTARLLTEMGITQLDRFNYLRISK